MIDIGIDGTQVEVVITHLNRILSDEVVLYVKTLNYHWNVEGPHFDASHSFFKKQYETLFEIVDVVAERIRTLGGRPFASLAEYTRNTRLSEDSVEQQKNNQQMFQQLLHDHETIIKHLRRDIKIVGSECGDTGTENLLTDNLLEVHEKMAWMLRSFVSSPTTDD